ncbi:hypothetical protein [Xenophilus sp.]|jgi:hypothetical protein|uniref:hypothetical protein n=1 Tax=Xenophilus sp. TaxID=1873499 RepID=UPI0037DCA550
MALHAGGASTDPDHLLIAFADRRAPACEAARGQLRLPALDALLARLAPQPPDAQDEDSLSPPHERALAAALGLAAPDGGLPWAALAAQRAGLPESESAPWGFVTLCHWQVGMSEVVLGDPERLQVDAAESAALLDTARPFFEEDGIALFEGGRPGLWLARGAVFDGLATASADRAAGRPLADWLPMGEAARGLRRLQNEMQMLLYTHRANDERTARGQLPINSFWLSGTGRLTAGAAAATAPTLDTSLRAAALDDDGDAWAAAWAALDAGPVARLLERSRAGAAVRLTLCGDRAAQTWQPGARGLSAWLRRRLGAAPLTADVLEAL